VESDVIMSAGEEFDPPVTRLLVGVCSAALLVALNLGVALFFFPNQSRPDFVWEIPPFNAAFLGAVYLSAVVPMAALVLVRRWSMAQLTVPMITAFGFVLLGVSLAYVERFRLDRWATWLWFGLYLVLPLTGIYYVWLGRRFIRYTPRAGWLAPALLVEALALGSYAVALLAAPDGASAFWPWILDSFHARLYSGVFVALVVTAVVLLSGAARTVWLAAGLMHIVLGVQAIVGLVLVDGTVHRVSWFAPGTALWLSGFALVALFGVAMIRQGIANPAGGLPRERRSYA
jgi:hypothetical protein